MIYVIYALGFVVVIGLSLILYKKRQKVALVVSSIPTFLSLIFFWLYAKENFFSGYVCNESNGCMNETGLLFGFALFFIFISFILLLSSVLFMKFVEINDNRQ